MKHKEGCLGDAPGCVHLVPIGCVTRQELEDRILSLRKRLDDKDQIIIELKARLYDLEVA